MKEKSKIIVTYDIDHLGIKDHYLDLTIPKFVISCLIDLYKKNISIKDFFIIINEIIRSLFTKYDSWDCSDEWKKIEKGSTWFIAVKKGKGISYSVKKAKKMIKKLPVETIGFHSQSRNNFKEIKKEYEIFKKEFYIQKKVPLRFHYLQNKRLPNIDLFEFDSSELAPNIFSDDKDYYKPVNIMDTYLFSPLKMNLTFEEAKKHTLNIFKNAEKQNKNVMIDLHPHHLSKCFPKHRKYIYWLHRYLKVNKKHNY